MNNDLMFSSKKDDWTTPKALFDELNAEFHFTVDLCADDSNHLCDKYYTKENNGLDAILTGERVFCNCPYGKKSTSEWIRKCATCDAELVVLLIPARTDTIAFHEYIYHKAEIRFIKGRLKFGGAKNPAPFPSMLCIWRNDNGNK